jgi:CheY-like chemotaxis protein
MPIRILVADDSLFWRETLRTSLERDSGWMVFEAKDGSEAVRRSESVHPDFVVLDFRMPELDGLNAARQMKRSEPKLPIVMITIDKTPLLEAEARRAGVSEVFSKTEYMRVRDFVNRTLEAKAA